MNISLPQPSKLLSDRILKTVPFNERFPAGRLRSPVGLLPGHVRSLQELHLLLEPDVASLPGINLKSLPGWIESSIGDRALAEAVRKVVEASNNYVESCLGVYEVVGNRLEQARRIDKESRG